MKEETDNDHRVRVAARAGRSWPVQVEARLSDLGEVDEVSVLPLVERLVPEGSGLAGELPVLALGVSVSLRGSGKPRPV